MEHLRPHPQQVSQFKSLPRLKGQCNKMITFIKEEDDVLLGDLLNNDCDYDKVHDEPKEYMFT